MDDNKAIAVLKDSDKAISELMEAFIENEEAKYSKTKNKKLIALEDIIKSVEFGLTIVLAFVLLKKRG